MNSKKEHTREMILKASYGLFASEGFNKITMKDVCDVTGLSRGGLYSHFSGTKELFEAILVELNKKDEMDFYNLADVIIIGRGGGSIEDLWAFNEELVARAVFESEIPVISAVGHETDVTICDFVADLRAPTPSAAAECAVPDCFELKSNLLSCKQRLNTLSKNILESERKKLLAFEKSGALKNPLLKINDSKKDILYLNEKLVNLTSSLIEANKSKVNALCGKLDALSPLGVIARGYSVTKSKEKIIKSIKDVKIDDEITVNLSDGMITAFAIYCK